MYYYILSTVTFITYFYFHYIKFTHLFTACSQNLLHISHLFINIPGNNAQALFVILTSSFVCVLYVQQTGSEIMSRQYNFDLNQCMAFYLCPLPDFILTVKKKVNAKYHHSHCVATFFLDIIHTRKARGHEVTQEEMLQIRKQHYH